MAKTRRSFSVEQKLQIIREAEQNGITQTLRKYNFAHSLFLRWRSQFNQGGAKLLQPRFHKVEPELRAQYELCYNQFLSVFF
jgi:transposase-like protein